ncbi:unnamed protein product, partial [Coregonus sp. 'balchen']
MPGFDIQSKQAAKVEKRNKEYINIERLVYTQDSIFVKGLKDHKYHFKEAFKEEQFNDPEESEDSTAGRRSADLHPHLDCLKRPKKSS